MKICIICVATFVISVVPQQQEDGYSTFFDLQIGQVIDKNETTSFGNGN